MAGNKPLRHEAADALNKPVRGRAVRGFLQHLQFFSLRPQQETTNSSSYRRARFASLLPTLYVRPTPNFA